MQRIFVQSSRATSSKRLIFPFLPFYLFSLMVATFLKACLPLVIFLTACAIRPSRYVDEWREVGQASWYGPGFHGKKTSSGKTFDMYEKTAAHPTLPFGTLVEVKHLQNGRTVVVEINDRGPHLKKRIIDLAYAAALELGLIREGTATVELRILRFESGR